MWYSPLWTMTALPDGIAGYIEPVWTMYSLYGENRMNHAIAATAVTSTTETALTNTRFTTPNLSDGSARHHPCPCSENTEVVPRTDGSGLLADLRGHQLVGQTLTGAVDGTDGVLVVGGDGVDVEAGLGLGHLARVVERELEGAGATRGDVVRQLDLRGDRPASGRRERSARVHVVVQVGRLEDRGAVAEDVDLAVGAQVVHGRQRRQVRELHPHILRVVAGVLVRERGRLRDAGEHVAEREVHRLRSGATRRGDLDGTDGPVDRAVVGVAEVRPRAADGEEEADDPERCQDERQPPLALVAVAVVAVETHVGVLSLL